MPTERACAEKQKVENQPRNESRAIIIARSNRAVALECPNVRSQGFSVKPRILNQRITQDLAVIVVNKIAAERVRKNDESDQSDQNQPAQFGFEIYKITFF